VGRTWQRGREKKCALTASKEWDKEGGGCRIGGGSASRWRKVGGETADGGMVRRGTSGLKRERGAAGVGSRGGGSNLWTSGAQSTLPKKGELRSRAWTDSDSSKTSRISKEPLS